ncbi:MAG: FliM/FliN family flagellar motor switch protein [Cyanobacteria bacterium P01_H01_bin.74]
MNALVSDSTGVSPRLLETITVVPFASAWQPILNLATRFSEDIAMSLQNFWGIEGFSVKFLGASEQPHYFCQQAGGFHVSSIDMAHLQPLVSLDALTVVEWRFSEPLCSQLLDASLGQSPEEDHGNGFSLDQVTPLENSLFQAFSKQLSLAFKDSALISEGTKLAQHQAATQIIYNQLPDNADGFIDLIWVISSPQRNASNEGVNADLGQLLVKVAIEAIDFTAEKSRPNTEQDFSDAVFFQMTLLSKLVLGKTKVKLGELHLIEPGDMIVLDESQCDTLFFSECRPGSPAQFSKKTSLGSAFLIQWDPARKKSLIPPDEKDFLTMVSLGNADSEDSQGQKSSGLWDNLHVDLIAELPPVKLPLKHLKQISEGIVVELGDVVNNLVTLQVDGKPIAEGELLIIGDKFGVRVRAVKMTESDTETSLSLTTVEAHNSVNQTRVNDPLEQPDSDVAGLSEATDPLSDLDDAFDDDDEDWD